MLISRWRYVCITIRFRSIYETSGVVEVNPEKQGLKPRVIQPCEYVRILVVEVNPEKQGLKHGRHRADQTPLDTS